MSRIWFSSDWHIGDPNVAGYRDQTVDENRDEILDFWTENVGKDDQVWFLGDLSIYDVAGALRAIQPMPGIKHMIAGNHDPVSPSESRHSSKHFKWFMETFESVATQGRRKIAGEEVLLSHFPYTRDHCDPPRHMQWRYPDFGKFLLHGHTHDEETFNPDGREIHVGWDEHRRFLELNEIATIIKDRKQRENAAASEEGNS